MHVRATQHPSMPRRVNHFMQHLLLAAMTLVVQQLKHATQICRVVMRGLVPLGPFTMVPSPYLCTLAGPVGGSSTFDEHGILDGASKCRAKSW
jgi:hypothetical protein